LKQEEKEIWFPAKKYGYGWGLPITWQGWVFSLSYLLLIVGGSFTLTDSPRSTIFFLSFALILSILFIFICFLKGEKPQWRWGDKK
jgi:hypothetical protein